MEDDGFDELLRRVAEESRRHYEQVEVPRILSQQPTSQAGPSRYFNEPDEVETPILKSTKQEKPEENEGNSNDVWEDMEWEDGFETAMQMHQDEACPTTSHAELDTTLTTLDRNDEAPGFHREAGRTWIFPTDFPERRYQFDICQTAIFNDTLVCLPTGLGKTFIAAVVMYNMYRWYPQGCVIFLAPTRPLVNQQVAACRNVAGLPQEHTAELTGSINPTARKELWRNRRVFFMTPQTLSNDLASGISDPLRIRCVVLDEAHRARGGHAYCQLLSAIRGKNKHFRLLALSATPGANLAVVKEVLLSLAVSRLEYRAEDSEELTRFTHKRNVESIVLPLGSELKAFKDRIYNAVDEFSRTLRKRRLVQSCNLTKFGVLKASQAFRLRGLKDNVVESEFAVTLALCQAAELLCHHGLRAFHSNMTGLMADPTRKRISCRLQTSTTFTRLLQDVGEKLAPQETASASLECTHPKMQRLVQLVVQHFQQCQLEKRSSRVIVFCQFRDVVTEIQQALENHRPLVLPAHLIGQANSSVENRGQAQKQQRQVLRDFNAGVFNVLISTCVGEEGLDIAEVDLIVCYEPHASPVRLVQRMGRTGRKRDGRVVMLMTEGREQQKYQQSVSLGGTISRHLLQSENFREALATKTHSMIPSGLVPVVMRMKMNKQELKASNEPKTNKTNKEDLRAFFTKKSVYASHEAMLAIGQPMQRLLSPELGNMNWAGLDLGKWIEWQRLEQDVTTAKHSTLTNDLVRLLQFSTRPKLALNTDNLVTATQLTSTQGTLPESSQHLTSMQGPLIQPSQHLTSTQGPPKESYPHLASTQSPLKESSQFLASSQGPLKYSSQLLPSSQGSLTESCSDHVCNKCLPLRRVLPKHEDSMLGCGPTRQLGSLRGVFNSKNIFNALLRLIRTPPRSKMATKNIQEAQDLDKTLQHGPLQEEMLQHGPFQDKMLPNETLPIEPLQVSTLLKNETLPNGPLLDKTLPHCSLQEKMLQHGLLPNETLPNRPLQDEALPNELLPDEMFEHGLLKNEMFLNGPLLDEALPNGSFKDEALPNGSFKDEALPNGPFKDEALPNRSLLDKSLPSDPLPDETLHSVEWLLQQLSKQQAVVSTTKPVSNTPSPKSSDPLVDLDLSDLLEGFNNADVTLGNSIAVPKDSSQALNDNIVALSDTSQPQGFNNADVTLGNSIAVPNNSCQALNDNIVARSDASQPQGFNNADVTLGNASQQQDIKNADVTRGSSIAVPNDSCQAHDNSVVDLSDTSQPQDINNDIVALSDASQPHDDSSWDDGARVGHCQRRQIVGRRRKCPFVESEAESSGRDDSDGENTSGQLQDLLFSLTPGNRGVQWFPLFQDWTRTTPALSTTYPQGEEGLHNTLACGLHLRLYLFGAGRPITRLLTWKTHLSSRKSMRVSARHRSCLRFRRRNGNWQDGNLRVWNTNVANAEEGSAVRKEIQLDIPTHSFLTRLHSRSWTFAWA